MARVLDGDRPKPDAAAGVFRGEVRYVVCSEVSGLNCNRPMRVDEKDCGISSHRRVVAVGKALGEARFRSKRRPTLVVEKDYDLVDFDLGEVAAFDPESFEPDDVWVATKVQQRFTAYHRVSADEAISNVRLVLARAAQAGNHHQDAAGVHRYWWRGYTVHVTPDLAAAIRYTTTHYERTPRMVADGVRSRLRRPKRERVKGTVPEDLEVGARQSGKITNVVAFGAFVDLGGFEGLVHKTEMGEAVDDPRELFDVGDDMHVEIIDVDRERARVALRRVI